MPWFDTGYQYKKSITIDHTKVSGGADLSSFPVLISMTDADLATVTNGGHVQNSSGFDIIFTNSAEDTKLDHEIEKYTASSGLVIMWVRIPTLSHTADTVIYVYFDNSSISSSQENATAVWDLGFMAAWHLKETAGTSNSIKDSTANANHGTPYTNYSSTVGDISTSAGEIDGAQIFDGSARTIAGPNSTSLNINQTNVYSISAWVKRAASNTTGAIFLKGKGGVGGYMLGIGQPSTNDIKITKFGVGDINAGTFPSDTNFHHVSMASDGTGMTVYVDGSSSGTAGDTQNLKTDTSDGWWIGSQDIAFWNGTIDEVRVSNMRRSAGWIGTEYNNQNSPSTFYSIGALTGEGNAPLSLVDTAISTTVLVLSPAYNDTSTESISDSAQLALSLLISESVVSVSSPTVQSSVSSSNTSTVLETLSILASLSLVDASQAAEIALLGPSLIIVDASNSSDSISFVVATPVTVYAIGYGRDGYQAGKGA